MSYLLFPQALCAADVQPLRVVALGPALDDDGVLSDCSGAADLDVVHVIVVAQGGTHFL